MPRIIIEDMKLNKAKRQAIQKDEEPKIITPPVLAVESKVEIKKTNNHPEEKEDITEVKINDYIKERSGLKRIGRTPQLKTNNVSSFKTLIFIFAIFFILIGSYFTGLIYQKANVIVSSKQQLINFEGKTFSATKDSNTDAIDFEIMITTDKKNKNIILTEPKDVSIKATGSVTLYNEFSLKAQKIVLGSFLTDNNGKTYKTNEAVTIPGYKLDKNKKIIPGQVEVNISSFLPGEAYNGNPTDFHITAFKATDKYTKIYGKLANPLVGGAIGVVYALDDINKENLNKFAQTSFKDELMKQVKAQVPTGYILYDDALTFSYRVDDSVLSKTPQAVIPIEGTFAVVLLKEKSLMNNLIKVSFPNITEQEIKEITIPNLNNLKFNFTNKDQIITKDLTLIPFYLTGETMAVWSPDLELLKTKLAGIKKDDTLEIFKQDPGILSAIVKIKPFWQIYIPKDLTKIDIVIK